jgi:hypothetical protein
MRLTKKNQDVPKCLVRLAGELSSAWYCSGVTQMKVLKLSNPQRAVPTLDKGTAQIVSEPTTVLVRLNPPTDRRDSTMNDPIRCNRSRRGEFEDDPAVAS